MPVTHRLMFLDYGTRPFTKGNKYIRKEYGESIGEAIPELKGKTRVSQKTFNKLYKKYLKKGRAGKGYIPFWRPK